MVLCKIYFIYHKTTGSAKNLYPKVPPAMEPLEQRNGVELNHQYQAYKQHL
jgi:hypothetical protein